jgi:hypothetical protein
MSATVYPLLEEFLNPGSRSKATHDLASLGAEALPQLTALLNGEAKNSFGVPYNKLGQPVYCGLVSIFLLGPVARPLERLVAATLTAGFGIYAILALRGMGALKEASIIALAEYLDPSAGEESLEAAIALARAGALNHASVLARTQASPRIAALIARISESEWASGAERNVGCAEKGIPLHVDDDAWVESPAFISGEP